jgi:acetyl/propionyl-CoA carboxylase alpha subunit
VPPEYDPLLAKLTAHAQTRGQAIARSLRAINEMFVGGIQTNLPLFRQILNDPDFRAGRVDTGYLDRLAVSGRIESEETDAEIAAIAGVIFSSLGEPSAASTTVHSARTSRWKHSSRYE